MKKYVLTLVSLASLYTTTAYAIRFDEGCSDQQTIDLAKKYPQVGILASFDKTDKRMGGATATLITIPNLPEQLKNRLIVTAKHCIDPKAHYMSFILANDGTTTPSTVEVESFLEAPKIGILSCLAIKSFDVDVAFGVLKKPMKFIEPLELSYESPQQKEILTLIGYGDYGSSS